MSDFDTEILAQLELLEPTRQQPADVSAHQWGARS